jgi:hypothetical protein
VFDRSEMVYFPIMGPALAVCMYCVDESSYKHFLGHKQIITKKITEDEVLKLNEARIAVHPDKGGSSPTFISANKRYKNALKLIGIHNE